MNDLIGRRIGPYEIKNLIGQGGMAEVYRAYQSSLNRYVASKFCRTGWHRMDNSCSDSVRKR